MFWEIYEGIVESSGVIKKRHIIDSKNEQIFYGNLGKWPLRPFVQNKAEKMINLWNSWKLTSHRMPYFLSVMSEIEEKTLKVSLKKSLSKEIFYLFKWFEKKIIFRCGKRYFWKIESNVQEPKLFEKSSHHISFEKILILYIEKEV